MKQLNLLSGLAAFCLLGIASKGQAAAYTAPARTNDWSATLAVAKSPTSGPALTSVTLNLTEQLTLVGAVFNGSANPGTITLTEYENLSLSGGNQTLTTSFSPVSLPFALQSSGFQTFNQSFSFSQSFTLTGADMLPYIGSGDLSLLLQTTSQSSTLGPSSMNTQVVAMSGATVDVTYNYAPVPEPAAGALLLVGAGALVLRRRQGR